MSSFDIDFIRKLHAEGNSAALEEYLNGIDTSSENLPSDYTVEEAIEAVRLTYEEDDEPYYALKALKHHYRDIPPSW